MGKSLLIFLTAIQLKRCLNKLENWMQSSVSPEKQNGSITLSTGILADDPVVKSTSAAMVNGALHSFVQAVALEIENGIRVNVVSLGMVEDSYERYAESFPGHIAIPMNKVVNAYVRSVNGRRNGEIIKIYN